MWRNIASKSGLSRTVIVVVLVMLCHQSYAFVKNLGQALDDIEGQVASLAGQLGSTAGLTERQLLDGLNMEITELRQQWKSSLDTTLESIDIEQRKTLDNLNRAIAQIHGVMDHAEKMQDYAVIDVNALLAKVGIAHDDQIRRVAPSAQVFKTNGTYDYTVTFPLFGTNNTIKKIEIGGVDVTSSKIDQPPHSFKISAPASALANQFEDWRLKTARLTVTYEISPPFWKFWASSISKTVTISTGLFPKQPLRYWFATHPHHTLSATEGC